MKVCVFEDKKFNNLFPLTYFRPVYLLRCGIKSLSRKIEDVFREYQVLYKSRSYLKDVAINDYNVKIMDKLDSDDVLFINGRVLVDDEFKNRLLQNDSEKIFTSNGDIIAVFVKGSNVVRVEEKINNFSLDSYSFDFDTEEIECRVVKYPWDLIVYNKDELKKDFFSIKESDNIRGKVYPGTAILSKENIFIGEDSIVKPNSVIDAENGPVYIGKNVEVMPNSIIIGPAYIGDNSIIKAGAKILEGTNIGEVCKIGGEVYNSIVQSYSNKQHDGFLGNSYIGSWVNLGAGTNNSDLKNNYGNVRMWVNNRFVNTGIMSVGVIMGDHTKTAINTAFNTGTIAGAVCNIFGEGFPPKYIPSFLWGGKYGFKEYNLEQGLRTMEIVMQRRNVKLSEEYKDLVYYIFNYTQKDRGKFIKNR